MKLIQMAKVREGRYLKNYELTYENKAGKEKVYEIYKSIKFEKHETIEFFISGCSLRCIFFV